MSWDIYSILFCLYVNDTGATAARGLLEQGDELVSINGDPFSGYMTHFKAWNYLKALPDGIARITVRR